LRAGGREGRGGAGRDDGRGWGRGGGAITRDPGGQASWRAGGRAGETGRETVRFSGLAGDRASCPLSDSVREHTNPRYIDNSNKEYRKMGQDMEGLAKGLQKCAEGMDLSQPNAFYLYHLGACFMCLLDVTAESIYPGILMSLHDGLFRNYCDALGIHHLVSPV